MTEDRLEERFGKLNKENKELFHKKIQEKRKEHKKKLSDAHREKIENQIDWDKEELVDFNIVISCFLEREKTDYDYKRTEPLYHEGDKNFDILIASDEKKIGLFVECERSLRSDLPGKIEKFLKKKNVVFRNESNVNIESYFSDTIGYNPDINEFVIASKQLPDERIRSEAKTIGENILAWDLTNLGNRCTIHHIPAKKEIKDSFDGHKDKDLVQYIEKKLGDRGVEFQDYIVFTYSSSNYYKLKNMAKAIVNRHHRQKEEYSFNYSDWLDLFEIELKCYRDEEKLTIYRNFLDYGQDCGVVEQVKDEDDIEEDEYRIKSRATKNQAKLIENIKEKIVKFEIEDELEEIMSEEKKGLISELLREQATGGATIKDFVNEE